MDDSKFRFWQLHNRYTPAKKSEFFVFLIKTKNQMITDKQRRNQIIRQIQKISPDKIKELQNFIDKLEENAPGKKKVLSYAGAWKDADDDVFKDLTDNLISKRKINKRRFED